MLSWKRRSRRRRSSPLALLLALLGCAGDVGPAGPQSAAEASRRFDEAIIQLSWAHQDLWKFGVRDKLAYAQIDTSLVPYYVRLRLK